MLHFKERWINCRTDEQQRVQMWLEKQRIEQPPPPPHSLHQLTAIHPMDVH